MAENLAWTRFAHYFLFAVQILFCTHLYVVQVSLDSKLSAIDSFQRNAIISHKNRVARSIDSDEGTSDNTTWEVASPPVKHHNRHSRVSAVSKFLVSTDSTTTTPIMQRHSRVKSTGMRTKIAKEEHTVETRERRGHNPVAVHYVGYIAAPYRHDNQGYLKNDRIKVKEEYKHWREANWTTDLWPHGQKQFKMRDGKVSVSRPGLYLLYAQIHYATYQTFNCYQARVNEISIAQCCATAMHSPPETHKATTCSMVTTAFLHSGDQVYLHDLHYPEVILNEDKSFFGLVQLISK